MGTDRQDLQDIQKKGQIVGNDILLYAYRGRLLRAPQHGSLLFNGMDKADITEQTIALAAVDFDIL
ncbi:hypothetical protein [Eisenbergiella tayi]|uniref:hypothetical protein n=1 Tax=Eisenbergiella tayi TaxID=1432052 RepID=UPI00084943A4|nr:hypothetical protein [Eisenbergiella tayi]ODR43317.1 hypothetical protein BEI60_00530 [Eisenbergiella tayi]